MDEEKEIPAIPPMHSKCVPVFVSMCRSWDFLLSCSTMPLKYTKRFRVSDVHIINNDFFENNRHVNPMILLREESRDWLLENIRTTAHIK